MRKRVVLVFHLFLVLSACATAPSVAPEAEREKTERGADIVRPAGDTSDAVMALLAEASGAERAGDLQRTEALLERALRIEPNNPVLWHYLARMRLKQGRFEQASGLAFKSSSLASDDERLQAENWRVVAHARRALGDDSGARAAEQRAEALVGR